MEKFSIEYIILAEDLNTAAAMAHDNVYLAEIEVEQVRIKQLTPEINTVRTFNEPATREPQD